MTRFPTCIAALDQVSLTQEKDDEGRPEWVLTYVRPAHQGCVPTRTHILKVQPTQSDDWWWEYMWIEEKSGIHGGQINVREYLDGNCVYNLSEECTDLMTRFEMLTFIVDMGQMVKRIVSVENLSATKTVPIVVLVETVSKSAATAKSAALMAM